MALGLRDHVRTQLVATLADIQRNAGREVPAISDETVPFTDLAGFDSLNGVEAAVLFSERVGVEIDELPLVKAGSGRLATVREVVDATVEKHGPQIAAAMKPSPIRTANASSASAEGVA